MILDSGLLFWGHPVYVGVHKTILALFVTVTAVVLLFIFQVEQIN